MSHEDFPAFVSPLIGLQLNHIWRGHGSALFLEFGELSSRLKRDGSVANPQGLWSLMIEWSWRIENASSILCGSWSDEALWRPAFSDLLGCMVLHVKTFGRLPEIEIGLSNELNVLSFMTAEGYPAWTLFDRRKPQAQWISVERAGLCFGVS
jgi:hypothetical protein